MTKDIPAAISVLAVDGEIPGQDHQAQQREQLRPHFRLKLFAGNDNHAAEEFR
jgi:hypothetical protein